MLKLIWCILKARVIFVILLEIEKVIYKYNLIEWMGLSSSFSKKFKILFKINSFLAKFSLIFLVFSYVVEIILLEVFNNDKILDNLAFNTFFILLVEFHIELFKLYLIILLSIIIKNNN